MCKHDILLHLCLAMQAQRRACKAGRVLCPAAPCMPNSGYSDTRCMLTLDSICKTSDPGSRPALPANAHWFSERVHLNDSTRHVGIVFISTHVHSNHLNLSKLVYASVLSRLAPRCWDLIWRRSKRTL